MARLLRMGNRFRLRTMFTQSLSIRSHSVLPPSPTRSRLISLIYHVRSFELLRRVKFLMIFSFYLHISLILMWPHMSSLNERRPRNVFARISGIPITLRNTDEAVEDIIAAARDEASFSVFTLNLHHLDVLRSDTAFRDAYLDAKFVTADGAPVAFLASLQGHRVSRAAGADLVSPLAVKAADNDMPVFLFGSTDAVLRTAENQLEKATGGRLRVAGREAPPQGFDPQDADADAALDRIELSGARLCFLALGAPKQEMLAARATARDIKVGFVCVGAALDFIAGTQIRAPQMLRVHGLEWLWRLCTNPRRLAGRYARCFLTLIKLLLALPSASRTRRISRSRPRPDRP